MRKKAFYIFKIFFSLIVTTALLSFLCNGASSEVLSDSQPKMVIAGGNTVGISMFFDGVLVIGFSDIVSNGMNICPAKDAGLKKGDIIYCVNEKSIKSSSDFEKIVQASQGKKISLKIKRNDKLLNKEIHPALYNDAYKYKIGAWVRDSIAGIGTITYTEPKTKHFAALGHKVADAETDIMPKDKMGNIIECTKKHVIKSEAGVPGEIQGSFSKRKLGAVTKNTQKGIFGSFFDENQGRALYTAKKEEVEIGKATILTDVLGNGVEEYSAEIENIFNTNYEQTKSMIIKITDEKLLARTGGIVQGMSGSPIIQNGKLIGAITHVFVNDPQKGYGIFIENMIAEAQN